MPLIIQKSQKEEPVPKKTVIQSSVGDSKVVNELLVDKMQPYCSGCVHSMRDFEIVEELSTSVSGSVFAAKWKRRGDELVVCSFLSAGSN